MMIAEIIEVMPANWKHKNGIFWGDAAAENYS
jgi:hypothetical protein